MKKSNKHIRSVSNHSVRNRSVRNRSVFVPLSATFCATALAITGGVVANASAVSSVASSSSVVKSSATKVTKAANYVTGGVYRILSVMLFSLLQLILLIKMKPTACMAVRL